MSAPDPEGLSLAAKVIGAVAAVGVPVGTAFAWLNRRFDKKADKHTVNNQLQEIKNEQALQRGHIGKIFDQMRDDRDNAEKRHREILMHLLERKP